MAGLDFATMRRYLDALYLLKKVDPVWVNEVLRELEHPLNEIHEYLAPIATGPIEQLSPHEQQWRRMVDTLNRKG